MAYRGKFTLPMPSEEFFVLHPEEVLAHRHRPEGWTKAVKQRTVDSEQRIAHSERHSPLEGGSSCEAGTRGCPDSMSYDAPVTTNRKTSKPEQPNLRGEDLVMANKKTSKLEHSGTIFLKPTEQHSVIHNANPKPDIKEVIKTGKMPPDTDLWELFLALIPVYKRRMAGLLDRKEQQFRALPRKNQWQWIKPTWNGLHGYKLHEHMPKKIPNSR